LPLSAGWPRAAASSHPVRSTAVIGRFLRSWPAPAFMGLRLKIKLNSEATMRCPTVFRNRHSLGPVRIPDDFPQVSVRVLKVAGVTAPEGMVCRLDDCSPRGRSFCHDCIDFGF